MDLRSLIHDGPVVLELVQPRARGPDTDHHLDELREALDRAPIDAINLPEVVEGEDVDDAGNVEPLGPTSPPSRVDVLEYGQVLGEKLGTRVIANHVAALRTPETLDDWLDRADGTAGVDAVVLVGGTSGGRTYPGPDVPGANARARDRYRDRGDAPLVGNVAIQGRETGGLTEPERMVEKAKAGADFFTSQIIYEADPVVDLLARYEEASEEAGLEPRPVLLTFAPVDRPADVDFLRQLRVQVPDDVEDHLLADDAPPEVVRDRSVSLVEAIWSDIQSTLRAEEVRVPTGLNVAHVRWHNLEAAVELAWRLPTVWPPQRRLDAPEVPPSAQPAGPTP